MPRISSEHSISCNFYIYSYFFEFCIPPKALKYCWRNRGNDKAPLSATAITVSAITGLSTTLEHLDEHVSYIYIMYQKYYKIS